MYQERLLGFDRRKVGIATAAWQLEDAIRDRHISTYPSNYKARELHFEASEADQEYGKALLCLVLLTIFETPAWCTTSDHFFEYLDPEVRCRSDGVSSERVLLSHVPYIPPGWSVAIELILVFVIARKLLIQRKLQVWYFDGLGVEYNNLSLIHAGLAMVVFEIADCMFFILWRPTWRLAFLSRTGYLCLLPAVIGLSQVIFKIIGEVATVSVFYVIAILFFAWIGVTIFADNDEMVNGVPVNKGFTSYITALNTIFVAGSTDDFVACFLPSYTKYRMTGILWLVFLAFVQVLLLNLVLDTLVSAYMEFQENTEETTAKVKVNSILEAFKVLSTATTAKADEPTQVAELNPGGQQFTRMTSGSRMRKTPARMASKGRMDREVSNSSLDTPRTNQEISKDLFVDFILELGRSPQIRALSREQAEIIFRTVDKDRSQLINKNEFCDICGVIAYEFWTTPKYSALQNIPSLWNCKSFIWFREAVETGEFDGFMNTVLLVNLLLVVVETVYDLSGSDEPVWMEHLELSFSLIYLLEVGLNLCVMSWGEYWSQRSYQFDFVTTWLLLASSILDELAEFSAGATIKRYVNILRLLRLLRVMKKLTRYKAVTRMVEAISSIVMASKDILTLLGVVTFFFAALSVNMWGGILHEGDPKLEGTEYEEKHLWVLNFNDFGMACGVWVVMLLCEYLNDFPEAITEVTEIPCVAYLIFIMFYILGVSIIFELVKAFTIEVYLNLKAREKKLGLDHKEFQALDNVTEEFSKTGQSLHYRVVGDQYMHEKVVEALEKMDEDLKEEGDELAATRQLGRENTFTPHSTNKPRTPVVILSDSEEGEFDER